MSTVNIYVDMQQDTSITIEDVTAAAGKHLFKFFTDGINVFNIASKVYSSDAVDKVTVNEGVSFQFDITTNQAKLLNKVASAYKHYLIGDDGSHTLKNEGTVTVTESEENPIDTHVHFINGNRIATTNAPSYSAKAENDIIIAHPTGMVQTVISLPDADTMPGKIMKIKLTGSGTCRINTPNGTQLQLLDSTGENCEVLAVGSSPNDWQVFFQP